MFKKLKVLFLIIILILQIQYIWSDYVLMKDNGYSVVDETKLIEKNNPDITINKSLNKININMDIPGFYMKDKDEKGTVFQIIDIPGWVKYEKVGEPNLPLKSIVVELTEKDEYNIDILEQNEIVVSDVNIYPSQIKLIDKDSENVFQKNKSIYTSDSIYPEKTIVKKSLIKKRDKTYLVLEIVPIRVNPVTGKLYVTKNLNIEISFNDPVNTLFFSPVLMSESSYINPELDKYMIIIDDQFENNLKLKEFIEWKKKKGLNVKVVKTSSFPSEITGAPKVEDIIRYMRKINIEDYPEYLLIIGNESEENGVPGTKSSIQVSTSVYFDHYTDLYTACRDDNGDIVPDLLYGRLPVNNNSELTIILNKIITMDKNPPRSSMYDKLLVASQLQDVYAPYNECDMTFAEISDAVASFFETNYDGNIYQTTRAISIETDGTVDENCKWNPTWTFLWKGATVEQNKIGSRIFNNFIPVTDAQDRILSNINNGISLLQYVGHGNYDRWKYPEIDYTKINGLTNGQNFPFVFSSTCLTGAYHKPNNFTKAFLLNENGGSHAVASHLNVTSIYNTDLVIYGMYMGFLDKFREKINIGTNPDFTGTLDQPNLGTEGTMYKLGEILNFGKDYMLQVCGTGNNSRYVMETLQLFGDPDTFMSLHEPVDLNINHPVDIGTGSQQINVHTYDDGVKVCIYNDDMQIHQVKESVGGSVLFDVENYASGKINITATKYGKRPYIGEINVSTDYGFIKKIEKKSLGVVNFFFLPQFSCSNVDLVYTSSSVTNGVINMTLTNAEWKAEVNNLNLNGEEVRYKFRYTSGTSTFETIEFRYNYAKDHTPPTAPTIYNITSNDDDPIKIIWCVPKDNENLIKNYKIYVDNDLYLTTEGDVCDLPELRQIVLDNLFKYASYSITISAVDIDGNESAKSENWNYSLEDTIAPSAPGNLRATNVSAASVSLLWNISTDNVGVDHYKIYDGIIENYDDWDDRIYFAKYDGSGPLYFLKFNNTSSINLMKRNPDGTASVVEGSSEILLDSTSYSLYDIVVKWNEENIINSEIWIHFGSSSLNKSVVKYKLDGTKQQFNFTNYISGISLNSYDNNIWVVSRDKLTWYQSKAKYIHKIDPIGNITHAADISDFTGCTISADTPDGSCWLANQEGSVYKIVKILSDGTTKTFDTINSKISKLQFNPVDNSCWFFSNQREVFFGRIKSDDTVSIEINPTLASSLAVDKSTGYVWMIYSEDTAKTDDKLVSINVINGNKTEYNISNNYYSENDLVINPVDNTPWWRAANTAFHLIGGGGIELGQTANNSFTVQNLKQLTDYYFIVYAYDKNGNRSKNSNILKITTGEHNTLPPEVSITAPVDNSSFTNGDNIEITANASDPDGNISNVEFYSNNIKIGEDDIAPYSIIWNNYSIGSHKLVAVAYDNLGVSTGSSPVNIIVKESVNNAPTVMISSPNNGDKFNTNENITIQANAADSDGTVSIVEFYANSVKIGEDNSSPYSYTWNTSAANNYDITVKAIDDDNAETVSTPVNISIIEEVKSAVKIQYECREKNAVSSSISFNLNIVNTTSSDININNLKIRYYYTIENPAPQEFHCDYAVIGSDNVLGNFINTDGNNYYLEISFGPSAGILSSYSQTGNIQIRLNKNNWSTYNQADDYSFDPAYNSFGDYTKIDLFNNGTKIWPENKSVNSPPSVNITSPLNGEVFTEGNNFVITASASDSDGTVSVVEFYEGTTKIGEDTTAPYSVTWNNAAAGNYTITAKAKDNDNASADSANINITVNPAANEAPVVNITSPLNGVSFIEGANVVITAFASDLDGTVSVVEFYEGTTKIGEDTTTPYSFTWSNVAVGNYTLTVKAIDDDNAVTTSVGVSVTVNPSANEAPVVSITSPSSGEVFTEGDNIVITASASDSDGTVSVVEFYEGTTKIGEDTAAPYSVTWNNAASGNYSITAKATDNDNASGDSTGINITVNPASNEVPVVNITNPSNGEVFTEGDNIVITASASDSDGTVSVVEFYEGTTKIGEDTTAPYSFTWNNVAIGNYTLTAKATDDDNASTVSSGINISVIGKDPSSDLVLQYQCLEANTNSNSIRFNLNIVNNGNTNVSLNNVKLRYYLTVENPVEIQFHCDYSTIGSDNIIADFVNTNGNNYYLEISFSPSAGELNANNNGELIQIRFNKINWSMFDQSNDYSFDSTIQSFTDHTKTTMYLNGSLVWGQQP